MATITALKREVESIQRALNMEKDAISIVWHFHREGEPHGCMGSVRMILPGNGENAVFEPLSYEEEMESFSKKEYEIMMAKYPHMRSEKDHIWSTYDKWVESHRCGCGHHGEDGKQPFHGVTSLLREYEVLTPKEKASQTAETLEAYKNGELSEKQQTSYTNSEESTGDLIVEYRELPQAVVLDRKYGIRKFTVEELDIVCREKYGESYAKYNAERDCCVVTFPKAPEAKATGGGYWTTIKLGKTA